MVARPIPGASMTRLFARHAIGADRAFEMLCDHSQHNGRKLVDVAEAVVEATSSC